jgi:transposase
VYVDESGFERTTQRDYGYALRGQRVHGFRSGNRRPRTSLIAGLINKKLTAPFLFEGTCDTDTFNIWLKQQLVPELKPGTVVVLDNATFHKSPATKEIIDNARCDLLFLPPYSPDLIPIENTFGTLKRHRKNNDHLSIDDIVRNYQ